MSTFTVIQDGSSTGGSSGKARRNRSTRSAGCRGSKVPIHALAGHYHDTYGMGVANVHASYEFGLRVFDSSVAGLGGCPYAKGATGNVATEDIVYLLHGLGADTGIDLDALVECGAWISTVLRREIGSRVSRAMLARGS